ncbi:MAG: hypothetical protein JXR70_00905 [Spirochaetales bacterium]|nr:hypothetical protein [Spirochaetales bacterium]
MEDQPIIEAQNQRDLSSLFSFHSSHNHKWSGALVYGAIAAGISYLLTLMSLLFFGMSPILGQMSVVLMMAALYYYSFRADKGFFVISVVFALLLVLPRQFFVELVMKLYTSNAQASSALDSFRQSNSQLFVFNMVWDILFFALLGFALIFERFYGPATWRALYRLLAALGVSMIIMAIVSGIMFPAEQFIALLDSMLPQDLQGEVFQKVPIGVFYIAFIGAQGFVYFINLIMACSIGRAAAFRHSQGKVAVYNLAQFYLPADMVWGVIISLGLIMLFAIMGKLELLALVCVPLVFLLFLFGLQGMGIIRYLLTKRASSSYIFRLAPLLVLALVSMISPYLLMVIVGIVIPGLGVSEIWIKYRKSTNSTRGNQNESDS